MLKENQRVALTKRLLKEALWKLLEKKHISKISVSELCQTAAINRTTFYRHYETPRDVLQEIALDQIRVFSDGSAAIKQAQDVKEFVVRLCIFLYDQKEMVKVLIRNDTGVDFTQLFQTLTQYFLGSRAVWYKGKVADINTLYLFNTFFTMGIYALISRWLMEDIPKTPEEIAELIDSSFSRDFAIR